MAVKNNDDSLLGQKYGKLTIIGFQRKISSRGWDWVVQCECGTQKVVSPSDVKSGKTKSCGCLLRETSAQRMTKFKHGVKENKRLYGIYNGIKRRCYSLNEPRYKDYGGRGIRMCDEWKDRAKGFDQFVSWSLSHGYSENMTIDRIDVDGNYTPENCRWVTLQEQNGNKRQTHWVDYQGEHIQLYKLCQRLNLSYDLMHDRIYGRRWSVEKAVETPSIQKDSLMQKCREKGLNYGTVRSRIVDLGWSEEEAFNIPSVGRGFNHHKTLDGRACRQCGKEYFPVNSRNAYCSAKCREMAKKERRTNHNL